MMWHPLTRAPNRLLLVCNVCRASTPNVSSMLRGWEQSATWRGVYRCPACSGEGAPSILADLDLVIPSAPSNRALFTGEIPNGPRVAENRGDRRHEP